MTETGKPLSSGNGTKTKLERCTIVSYPKIVFFYPLLFASIICGIFETISPSVPGNPEKVSIAGAIFMLCFLSNLLIISFDFPGVRALVLVFAAFALIFGLIILDVKYQIKILAIITDIYRNYIGPHLYCSAVFYYCVAAILAVMIVSGILGNWM